MSDEKDDEKSQSGEAPAAEPAESATKTPSSDNPFDMAGVGGLDFEEVKKRRERDLAEARAREAEKQNEDDDIKVIKIGSLFDDDPIPIKKETPKKYTPKSSAPGRAESGSFDEDSEDSEDEEARRQEEIAAQKRREREMNTIKVGTKTLSKWPYDHYHMVQEEYWKRYFEREEQARIKQQHAEESDSSTSVSISSSDEDEDESSRSNSNESSSSDEESSSDGSGSETSSQRMERKHAARRAKKREERRQRKKQEKKRLKRLNRDTEKEQEKRRKMRQKATEEERQSGLHELKSDILVFERPQDPPELSLAVADLPLAEFESVAKERAITYISTWLFDAGLVQELMATKKASKDLKALEEEEEKKKEKKVKIEIVGAGKGKEKKKEPKKPQIRRTKMDVEIEKLEKTVRAQLEVITLRLNKGVAASGSEVQDLVNSVISTKGALVNLRKTSSMINDASGKGVEGVAGMAASQTTFAINKYPHLKFAINARKNLTKCFRELEFFSLIPENCARLSEMLNSAEWSEHEWITLRKVCVEHVKLEIFLVSQPLISLVFE
jgi:hypothetical protein